MAVRSAWFAGPIGLPTTNLEMAELGTGLTLVIRTVVLYNTAAAERLVTFALQGPVSGGSVVDFARLTIPASTTTAVEWWQVVNQDSILWGRGNGTGVRYTIFGAILEGSPF